MHSEPSVGAVAYSAQYQQEQAVPLNKVPPASNRSRAARKNGPDLLPGTELRFIIRSIQSLICVDRRTAISDTFQYRITLFWDMTPY